MKHETITVAIAGINGRMGRTSVQAIQSAANLKLVGAFGKEQAEYVGKKIEEVVGLPYNERTAILVSNNLTDCLDKCAPDVLLDFTEATSALRHGIKALEHKVRPVIGTSGLTAEHLKELEHSTNQHNVGAMVVPNFSVGAILMMNFAEQAGHLFKNAEIVEMHKLGKLDAPSGTAMHTAKKISNSGHVYNESSIEENEILPGARGGKTDNGLRVHSVRLPGILSHQEVYFAQEGELLTIKHESFNTKCFIQGILISLQAVMKLKSLVVGLDSFVLPKA
jgi:4-hydroxy-tetrahydrodipicolinate reductase